MAAAELVTGITVLEGASPLAEGPAKILFSGISGHLGSETAVPLGLEKRLFFKDPSHLFPDLVARLPSAAGLVRNMRKPG